MEKLCRICAKEGKILTPLWSKRSRRKKSAIVDNLNFILLGHETIEEKNEDTLPKSICNECLKKLSEAVKFVKECLEAQKKLKGVSDGSSTKSNETKVEKSFLRNLDKNKTDEDCSVVVPEITIVKEEVMINDYSPELDEPPEYSSDESQTDIKVPIKANKSSQKTAQDKNYQCSHCQRTFNNKFRLKNHLRIHTGERPFICKTCNKAFAQPNALKCHIRLHTGEKPYKCPIESCGRTFTQNTTLKTHMVALHTGKTVKCDSCDKTFTRASYLTAHKRLEHLGERPYACHLCPNRYKQKSHLDHHLEVHQGVKYVCPVCNKNYSKKWSLQVHSFTHFKDGEVQKKMPHACTECDESFARRDKLRAHVKTKHENRGKKGSKVGVRAQEEVPVPSNVVEVESRPIILQQGAVEEFKEFEGRQYHVINISEGTNLIQEIVIPSGTLFY